MRELILELADFNEGISAARKYVESGEITQDIVDQLIPLDPTNSKKYIMWMTRTYIKDKFKPEDIFRFEAITKYNDLVTKNLTDKRNIEAFSSLQELESEVAAKSGAKSKTGLKKEAKIQGTKVIMDTPKVKIWKILTKEAAQQLGKGTKWCTSAMEDNRFNHYHDDLVSDIYIVIPKGEYLEKHGKISVVARAGNPLEVWDAKDNHLSREHVAAMMKDLEVEV